MKVKLHPHQKDAIDKMHNGCVLWGGGGTGKTITSLAYSLLKETGRPIVVVTTAKVRDSFSWEKEAAKLRISPDEIQVTSWNKINDFVGYKDHLFIFDEQRIVGSGAWVKAFHKIAKANRWILLSATPGDTWSDYSALFIANGWYKNITEFRREHAIYSRFVSYPKITGWRNEGRLQKYRKALLVEMPMIRHTTRTIEYVECEYDEELLDKVRKDRWNVYEDKPIENASELYSVMRKVVSTHPSRAAALKNLLDVHPKLIVFYNYNYELDMLREVCTEYAQGLASPESSSSTTPAPSPTGSGSSSSDTTEQWIQPHPSDYVSIGVRLDNMTFTDPQGYTAFMESLPPWHLTDEETAAALDQWVAKHTEGESWESKASTSSRTTTAPRPSSPSRARSASTAEATTSTPRSSAEQRPEPTASASRSSTASRTTSTASTTSTTSPSRTTPPAADLWAGTIWDGDWEPSKGTPDPRLNPRSEKAKYEFEAKQRKAGQWPTALTESSPSSTTSTIYHASPKDTSEPSSSTEVSGSTKTSATTDTESLTTVQGDFGWAEWNGHKHQDIPDTDRWVYLVQYQSGAEGWNCTETDAMAFWSLTYSWKLYEQAMCRIDRLNTPFRELKYSIMMANSPAEKPVMMSLDQKKDFQPR